MNLFRLSCTFLSIFAYASLSSAGSQSSAPTNQRGYYLGLGVSFNAARLNSSASANLNAVSGFPPLGEFSGETGSYKINRQSFAPDLQLGYFQNFSDRRWLWGAELMYQYANISNLKKNNGRGTGTSITVVHPTANVTDAIELSPDQTKLSHQWMLPLLIGYSYTDSFIYFGVGPSLFNVQKQVRQISDASSALYLGTADGFNDKKWVWGGAVQAGMAYYVNSSMFLRLNYTYAVSKKYSISHSGMFTADINQGLNTGTINLYSRQRVNQQDIALSMNKLFSL